MNEPPKRRRLLIPINRHVFTVTLAAIALQAFFGFLLGWGFASFVVAAGLVGYSVGTSRGFKFGMDHSYAGVLRGNLAQLTHLEELMAEELAPDSEERVHIAKLKGELIEELRRVA